MTLDSEDSETISPRYKEELCVSLLEAMLSLRPSEGSSEEAADAWLMTALEAAEIGSKTLDWKVKSCHAGQGVA